VGVFVGLYYDVFCGRFCCGRICGKGFEDYILMYSVEGFVVEGFVVEGFVVEGFVVEGV